MQGYVKAQYIMGMWYGRGIGTSKDYVMAHAWLSLASKSGDEFVQKVFKRVQTKVSEEDVVEANRLAGEWQAIYKKNTTIPAS